MPSQVPNDDDEPSYSGNGMSFRPPLARNPGVVDQFVKVEELVAMPDARNQWRQDCIHRESAKHRAAAKALKQLEQRR